MICLNYITLKKYCNALCDLFVSLLRPKTNQLFQSYISAIFVNLISLHTTTTEVERNQQLQKALRQQHPIILLAFEEHNVQC